MLRPSYEHMISRRGFQAYPWWMCDDVSVAARSTANGVHVVGVGGVSWSRTVRMQYDRVCVYMDHAALGLGSQASQCWDISGRHDATAELPAACVKDELMEETDL
jgi:hypothetical protein